MGLQLTQPLPMPQIQHNTDSLCSTNVYIITTIIIIWGTDVRQPTQETTLLLLETMRKSEAQHTHLVASIWNGTWPIQLHIKMPILKATTD